MKTPLIVFIIALGVILFSFKPLEPATWEMDINHAKLGFTVTHMMISDVDGYFKSVSATITSSGDDFTNAKAEMRAYAATISTDNDKRDADLVGPNYFDAAKYPEITFKSTSFRKTKTPNTYEVTGDLTIHGITKSVLLKAVCRMGENPMSHKVLAGFKVTGTINRKDFGVGASVPEAIVSNEVAIYANAEFIKK